MWESRWLVGGMKTFGVLERDLYVYKNFPMYFLIFIIPIEIFRRIVSTVSTARKYPNASFQPD